jgi:hydrogenase maturation protease
MDERIPLLILGLGNTICGDDGLGIVAVERLRAGYEIPLGVAVIDGGTLGLSLLPWVEDAQRVLLVDAIGSDDPAGTLVRLDGDDVGPAVAQRLSPHQIGVADLLDGARWRGRYPDEVVLLGLVPLTLDLSVDVSPPVAARLDRLVDAVVLEAARLGYQFTPRATDEIVHDRNAGRGHVATGM